MNRLSDEQDYQRWLKAANELAPHGWRCVRGWIFEKTGRRYDLSAADIAQRLRIEQEGLFLCS